MALNSEELDYLVYRYLLETGYQHAAFALSNESNINRTSTAARLSTTMVGPGALVHFVQRGLQYCELEANLAEDHTAVEEPYLQLDGHEVIMQDVSDLRDGLQHRKEEEHEKRQQRDSDRSKRQAAERTRQQRGRKRDRGELEGQPSRLLEALPDKQAFARDQVQQLVGHQSEVLMAAWSPAGPRLASSSGGAAPGVMLWDLPEDDTSRAVQRERLPLPQAASNAANHDWTCLSWSQDGVLLAGGSNDGSACIWPGSGGNMAHELPGHTGMVSCVSFSPGGGMLLTAGSSDRTVVVWDTVSGKALHSFAEHNEGIVDLDWRDADTFASAGSNTLHVCSAGRRCVTWRVRSDPEINNVRWSQDGALLAAATDTNVEVWRHRGDEQSRTLDGHGGEVTAVRWRAPQTGTPPHTVLSTSYDCTARLWDADTGACLHTLREHVAPVLCAAFSPCSRLLVTGGADHWIYVWSLAGDVPRLYKRHKGSGNCFGVGWSSSSDRVTATFNDAPQVCLLTVQLPPKR